MELRRHYETPEAELVVIRFEEHFLDGTYNGDNNEKWRVSDEDEDF